MEYKGTPGVETEEECVCPGLGVLENITEGSGRRTATGEGWIRITCGMRMQEDISETLFIGGKLGGRVD